MSELLNHASRELAILGMTSKDADEMDKVMARCVLELVGTFALQNHSGFSASHCLYMTEKLLKFEPLSPITDNPRDWMNVSDFMGPGSTGVWQCRRDSRYFSEDGGKSYYSVDEFRRGWRRKLFGRKGKVYKSLRSDS